MYILTFSRTNKGHYSITDNNDTRLLCIGSILVDPTLRQDVKKAVHYAPELGLGKAKQYETNKYSLHLTQPEEGTLLISLSEKTGEQLSYQTDMPLETFIDLIEAYEEAVEEDPHTITITRVQDTFELASLL